MSFGEVLKKIFSTTIAIIVVGFFVLSGLKGCYQKIDSFDKWAKYDYNSEENNVTYIRRDWEKVYESFPEALYEREFLQSPIRFKFAVIPETRVSENIKKIKGISAFTKLKPMQKSLVMIAPFDYNALGEVVINPDEKGVGQAFDMEAFASNLKKELKNCSDPEAESRNGLRITEILSFIKNKFDYLYIGNDLPSNGGTMKVIDLWEIQFAEDKEIWPNAYK